MNIYFCGIGGVGLGPLAEIALDAGNTVVGSDPKEGLMTTQMRERGVSISSDQSGAFLQASHDKQPIDWFVYTSALPSDHPELVLAQKLGIKSSKRDELLAHIIAEKGLKLIAVAGTHGKTGTTAMTVWTFKQLGIPISYSIGTTLSFGPSGQFDPASEYFVYECDEYDRNFLSFHPFLSLITALSYDHPDTYPTQQDYNDAFRQFVGQSQSAILWQKDASQLGQLENAWVLGEHDVKPFTLVGAHYRENASLVAKAMEKLAIAGDVTDILNRYPGVDRRFEKLADNVYTDYAIHPAEIATTLKLAREINDDIVAVYQPHQNVRQHAVRAQYADCFILANDIYWLPTYLTREDSTLAVLTPEELTKDIPNHDAVHISELDDTLWENIQKARERGALVLFMGAGSIDGWVRERLAS
jgi:UDP-N-acetylmuramate--alanine ligase